MKYPKLQEQSALYQALRIVRDTQKSLDASDPSTDKAWVILHNVLTHLENRWNAQFDGGF